MKEVDRVLRPGGYWVLSGPPINWKVNYKAWQRPMEDLKEEQRKIEEVAALLCWEKKSEIGEIAVWQKSKDTDSCRAKQENSGAQFCKSEDVWYESIIFRVHCRNRYESLIFQVLLCSSNVSSNFRYKKMEPCITQSNSGNGEDIIEDLKPFPERLHAVPPRIASGSIASVEAYHEDNKQWKKHVSAYRKLIKIIDSGRFRNIMDMNAGFGGFAAALQSPKLWVMNVVPTIAEENTLGVIYERGLIGIYHDWYVLFSLLYTQSID